jgi:tRNA threonylcarbamoyladenosine biosynthesis protein TsaB
LSAFSHVRVLAISSAYGGAAAAIIQQGITLAAGRLAEEHGLAAELPALVARLLGASERVDMVAVIVGPGSFTGLRAGLSVANGIGLGLGVPVIGVTVAEALAEEAAASANVALAGRYLWTALGARSGRVFIDRTGDIRGYSTDALPSADGPIALCGNAAQFVAGALAARGADVMLTAFRTPKPVHVAAVGLGRMSSVSAVLAVLPLYVDAAEAKLPAGGVRPPPATLGNV